MLSEINDIYNSGIFKENLFFLDSMHSCTYNKINTLKNELRMGP